ncbi:response regulator transcription factor [Entomobacter blattae]|uniref:response regulator transcription factor n=1 Tax=Entomobacter blattae TaxID=2762277 RepID=UPI0023B3067E|nr:response regulator transcription factor [Entomobacter blattae]
MSGVENAEFLPARILVVEDDPGMRTLLLRVLQANGFRVRGVEDGKEMWQALEASPYDLVILDIMLPVVNGLDLCRAIRQGGPLGPTQVIHHENELPLSQLSIIMVSARGEEFDRVLGLELGADDYVAKPFSQKELLARVRAVLRRGGNAAGQVSSLQHKRRERLSFAQGWVLDLRSRVLTAPNGGEVEISGAEYDLLVSFLENPQRVIGRDRLLELSRSRLGDASDRSIDVLVSRLRRKLGEDAETMIRTVRGVGYIFTYPVDRL